MERMEVDQCAGAAGGNGGGALRRSNSAPMITNVSDGMTVFSSSTSSRYRRSSVSVNPSCPSRRHTRSQATGGVESDGPPKKLFVAGVTDPAHITSCTLSVSQSVDSPSSAVPVCSSPQNITLSLSPPSPFTSQHPGI
ncbi:hypothetical protein Baya_1018 [Bagarius yarrelli]|uniref:Uncharacterized protein n=1 Tax=Bagarius yarrelli TaxID=175774 RepID=A0A556TJY0_BAGYA|nr:hypothetical protein Baya_1018 [Bagarius yarrelli]